MTDFRNENGESELLKRVTGKTYGQDKFTGTDLKRLHNIKPTGSMKIFSGEQPTIHVQDVPHFVKKYK